MAPAGVAPGLALRRRRGLAGVAFQPILDDVIIELLRPKHPRERLAMDGRCSSLKHRGFKRLVKLVRFLASFPEELIEIVESRTRRFVDPLQPQPNRTRFRRPIVKP